MCLLTCEVRVAIGELGLCCCVGVMSYKRPGLMIWCVCGCASIFIPLVSQSATFHLQGVT